MAEPVIRLRVRTILSTIAALLSFYNLAGLVILTMAGLNYDSYAIALVLIEIIIWYFIYSSFDPFKKEYYD